MKKVLGLDLGTTSIGWAFINEAEKDSETSSIQKIGVRVNPLSTDEITDFEKGKPLSVNADRTLKRGARRNLDRFQQRRDNLIEILTKHKIITNDTVLTETGNDTTHQTFALRAKSANEKIEKSELARVLLTINKKRGYKSSRKTKTEEDGQAIDGMDVAKILYEEELTPGAYAYRILQEGKKHLPDFYRSDLLNELNRIWAFQKQFYPNILTDEFYKALEGQGMQNTRKRFLAIHKIYTAENKGTRDEKKLQSYKWRTEATNKELDITVIAFVITEINNNLNNSSGYLGAISDRSKELIFNKETVGQYLYKQLQENTHTRTKGQVFYRQDYLDEFEKIWETQKQFHPELTNELKTEIRDVIIFYQRKLKSQKGLISFCAFESEQKEINGKTKTIGSRVIPKSSPLFQEFKIWQNLSNIIIKNKITKEEFDFGLEHKQQLFNELNIKGNLSKAEILKLVVPKPKEWDLNYTTIEGNRTNEVLYGAYQKILEFEGNEIDFKKLSAAETIEVLTDMFQSLGINTDILLFDALLEGKDLEKQAPYQLWHLLYSYEGDDSNSGNEKLYEKLKEKFGFRKEYAQILSNIAFQEDYGSLSAKAIRKIMPFIHENKYSDACTLAKYNHSNSITKEENDKRILKDKLELLGKNSLRNPVVEKILNQVVNVVNAIIEDPTMGKPDEIRIELARELKKNAKERAEMTQNINKAKTNHEEYRSVLQNDFGIKNPTRNDIIRYKLYLELAPNGYKTLYTNTYIDRSQLFTPAFEIEHIIPKARLFDDSFSNKTLAVSKVNKDKSDTTAYDYIENTLGKEALDQYLQRVEGLFKDNKISKAKYKKLLMKAEDIGEGFIERDLRDSQYIAKKAKEMLFEICRTVTPTTGSITDKLREDWDLINVMQELNLEKYKALGLTEQVEKKDGTFKERIIDWTKRNDHRHHAMDALTVAFTKHNHIQFLNNLSARKNETHKKHAVIHAIENKETHRDERGKRKFNAPMPNFRTEAKRHLEQTLISHKAKNKVVTRNKNKVAQSNVTQIALTPRGQMHKETVYGKLQRYEVKKEVKIGTKFDEEMILKVAKKKYREALLLRLQENNNDPKKAFGGKNSPTKNPILYDGKNEVPERVNLTWLENIYTIRKEISPDLKLEKVIDVGTRKILQARLDAFNGKPKEAFVDLDKNPIWLNEEKGISIKRVTITGVSNAEPLHNKKDHLGNEVLTEDGKSIAVDYVSTGNNHHVAIYRDSKGDLQEEVVSFYEAVARVNANAPIIFKEHPDHPDWEFLFTMKQNELFVFPTDTFDPTDIDLLDPNNTAIISPHLFRVQKISTKNYVFNHHLETSAVNGDTLKNKKLSKVSYYFIQTPLHLKNIIKVRMNHLGQLVHVGE